MSASTSTERKDRMNRIIYSTADMLSEDELNDVKRELLGKEWVTRDDGDVVIKAYLAYLWKTGVRDLIKLYPYPVKMFGCDDESKVVDKEYISMIEAIDTYFNGIDGVGFILWEEEGGDVYFNVRNNKNDISRFGMRRLDNTPIEFKEVVTKLVRKERKGAK